MNRNYDGCRRVFIISKPVNGKRKQTYWHTALRLNYFADIYSIMYRYKHFKHGIKVWLVYLLDLCSLDVTFEVQ
jgi:hypothetical protein